MAVNLEKLIDLDLLTLYDSNMKNWVNKQITSMVHVSGGELPTVGAEGTLYIKGTSIFLWDDEAQDYQEFTGETNWEKF